MRATTSLSRIPAVWDPIHRGRRALLLPLAIAMASCSMTSPRFEERVVERPSDVAQVGVAVVSAAPFELYVKDLSPKFEIDAETALKLVGASTRQIEDSFLRSTQTLIRLAPEVLSSQRTSTSSVNSAGVASATAAASSAAGPGDLSKVSGPTIPADALPTAFSASAPSGINPMLQYQLANALIQEVRLLNDYVGRAPRAKDHLPYVVRLQLGVQQKGRNTPYDAVTNLHFKLDDKGCDKGAAKPVRAIPLLVNDSIDISSAAVGSRRVNAVGLALSGLRGNIGLGFDVGTRTEHLLRALGSEFNPVLSVGQGSGKDAESTVRVRVGAMEKGLDKHELLSRSYMVTVLLLVPRSVCQTLDRRQREDAAVAKVLESSGLKTSKTPSPTDLEAVVKSAVQAGVAAEQQGREADISERYASVRFTASTTFEHARTGLRMGAAATSSGDAASDADSTGTIDLWTWPKPRLPGPQLTRLVLKVASDKEAKLYSGSVQLLGGGSLVDRLFDRACLRTETDPAKIASLGQAKKGAACADEAALLADSVKVTDDRKGVVAGFAAQLYLKPVTAPASAVQGLTPAKAEVGTKAKKGAHPADKFINVAANDKPKSAAPGAIADAEAEPAKVALFAGRALGAFCFDFFKGSEYSDPDGSFCTPLEEPLTRPPPTPTPKLDATVKLGDARLLTDSKGLATLTVSVEFPVGKNAEKAPSGVELRIEGAGAVGAPRTLSGSSDCQTLRAAIVVTKDCTLAVDLKNLSPGMLIMVKAIAVRGDLREDLKVNPGALEVVLKAPDLAVIIPGKAP